MNGILVNKILEKAVLNVKGKIKVGCKVATLKCEHCRKDVEALKLYNYFECPLCGNLVVSPISVEGYPKSLPYFVVPRDLVEREVILKKPTSLKVMPAYREMDRICRVSYAKKGKGGVLICAGNGVAASRYDAIKKSRAQVPCGDDCPDKINGTCKTTGIFYFILPDFDVFSAYTLSVTSQSVANILSTLSILRGRDGLISRVVCELKLVEKRRPDANKTYHVVQLVQPAISLDEYKNICGNKSPAIAWEGINGVSPLNDSLEDSAAKEPAGSNVNSPAGDDTPERRALGRVRVKEKLKQFVVGTNAERALEIYSCEKYKTESFEDISVKDLLHLWHSMKEDSDTVHAVWMLATKLRHGVSEELPLKKGSL
ncbi:MAG: hypothetical protein C0415_05940 [Thermodesulfovibrio sp.]|nr:hypothetical protein [Thermodesulfovibrio sp.]